MISKEDKFLEGQILDKIRQCVENNMFTYTGFLDLHQQSFAQQILDREMKKTDILAVFYGGYQEAMRRILFFFPSYLKESWAEVLEDVLTAIEVEQGKDKTILQHRDYLGAFVGLGIKREMMGDILVQEQGANIFLLREILPIVLEQYQSVGRASVKVKEKALSEILFIEEEHEQQRGTVSSNRLDNILTMVFQVGRKQAQEWIEAGLVFVNYVEKYKNEFPIKEKDILVVRKKGKVKIEEFGSVTRKNKLPVYYIKY